MAPGIAGPLSQRARYRISLQAMELSQQQSRQAWRVAQASAAMALLLVLCAPAAAQKCNPVIDGTYCETQMPRSGASSSTRSSVTMRPIEDIGRSISTSSNSPATLGGISFGRGTDCIGLLRRGKCN